MVGVKAAEVVGVRWPGLGVWGSRAIRPSKVRSVGLADGSGSYSCHLEPALTRSTQSGALVLFKQLHQLP